MGINVSEVGGAIERVFRGKLANAKTEPSEFFDMLYARAEGPSGPEGPKWGPIETTALTTSTYAEGADFPAPGTSGRIYPYQQRLGRYVVPIAFSRSAINAAARQGENALFRFIANEVRAAMSSFRAAIDSDLRTNDPDSGDANGVSGIPAWVAATNTIAGINRSSESRFACSVVAVGGSLTFSNMRAILDHATTGLHGATRRGRATMWVADQLVIDQIVGLTEYRPMDPPRQSDIAQTMMGVVGDYNFSFFQPIGYMGGLPVIQWPGWVAGRLDLINMENFSLEVYQDFAPHQSGTTGEIQLAPVPGKDQLLVEYVFEAETKLENPYKDAAALTGIS